MQNTEGYAHKTKLFKVRKDDDRTKKKKKKKEDIEAFNSEK